MKKISVLLLFSVFSLTLISQNYLKTIDSLEKQSALLHQKQDSIFNQMQIVKLEKLNYDLRTMGLPEYTNEEQLVRHHAYYLVYNEKYEQAKWVAHIISTDVENGGYGRTNDFRTDPMVKTGSAEEADYFLKYLLADSTYKYDGFGYDRGHLAPSADFRWSKIALSESYFYSNMSPQVADFNRGAWADLESLLRAYVIENKTALFVVTGPVFGDSIRYVERSKNKVAIPDYFFKIAYDSLNQRGIAFLMPNRKINEPIESFAVTIDEVEKKTGINFFASLPKGIEEKIESECDVQTWLPEKQKGDVPPMKRSELPINYYNTVQAAHFINSGDKVKICGTVVSAYKSRKGNVFLNLDKKYPNQIFTVTIFNSNLPNFSYSPDLYLINRKICVYGKVSEYNGVSSMIINNEKQIILFEDIRKK